MWFRYPPKTWVQNKVFFGLYMALPVTLLGNGTVRRLCSNVAEINRLLRRRFWEFLFGFECCFVISHLIARGNDLGVIAISGGFAMAISAFKLVTPQASFGIPFFFLVNSAMAAAVLILAKDGLLCEASLHAMFPALLSLAALLISVAIPPRTKIE